MTEESAIANYKGNGSDVRDGVMERQGGADTGVHQDCRCPRGCSRAVRRRYTSFCHVGLDICFGSSNRVLSSGQSVDRGVTSRNTDQERADAPLTGSEY